MKRVFKIPIFNNRFRRGAAVLIVASLTILSGKDLPAQPLYQLRYPFSLSPVSGAEAHILLNHELSKLDNRFVPASIFRSKNGWSQAGNILYRLIRLSTYEFYMAYLPVVNQHEYFGHLTKAKQYHARSTRYEIYFFPPSGGLAFFGDYKYGILTDLELISVYSGGMEANLIMAENLRRDVLLKGKMSFQEAMLYLGSKSDFNTYVLFEQNDAYDDVSQYLSVINMNLPAEEIVGRKDLMLPSIFSLLLDPYTILSATKLIGQYLIKGQTSYDAPSLLKIGEAGMLPYYSFEPGADGLRHCLNMYMRTRSHLYYLCLHKGALSAEDAFGLQVQMNGFSMVRNTLSFDLDLRYWQSDPATYQDAAGTTQTTSLNGALFGGTLYLKLFSGFIANRDLFLLGGFSLKTPGYTKGSPIAGGLSCHIGLGMSG